MRDGPDDDSAMHFVATGCASRARVLLIAWTATSAGVLHAQPFADVTVDAGITHEHRYSRALAGPDGTFSDAVVRGRRQR